MEIASLRQQYQIKDQILKERLDTLLPTLQQECGIDLWLVPSREYNEDPVFTVLTPSNFPTARRTSLLALHKSGQRFCVNLKDPGLERFYTQCWQWEKQSQLAALEELLEKLQPKTIGLNFSHDLALADGLSVGLWQWLQELPEKWTSRFVSGENLTRRYLETRTSKEIDYLKEAAAISTEIINQTYSRQVLQVGVSTCEDLQWFMKEKVKEIGLDYWFEPTIDLQRKNGMFDTSAIIQAGDLLHCDFGLVYLGLCTDTQRLAYVLADGETTVPEALLRGFAQTLRFEDIVTSSFAVGKSGNEILQSCLAQAQTEGLDAMLYSHPLGTQGHGIGPTIGLYTNQKPDEPRGELTINPNTAYALELNTKSQIAGYENDVVFFAEESIIFYSDKVEYLVSGRENIYLI